jgi:hypothetical protein
MNPNAGKLLAYLLDIPYKLIGCPPPPEPSKQKKLSHLLRATQLFIVFSGNPAIPLRTLQDPWLSVTRLLGFWLYHESNLLKSPCYIDLRSAIFQKISLIKLIPSNDIIGKLMKYFSPNQH